MAYLIVTHRGVPDDRQWVEDGRTVVESIEDARTRARTLLAFENTPAGREHVRRQIDSINEDGGTVVGDGIGLDIRREAA